MGAIVLSAAGFMAGYYTCQASLTEKTSRKSVRAKEREAALMGREKEFKLVIAAWSAALASCTLLARVAAGLPSERLSAEQRICPVCWSRFYVSAWI
eukprot:scaffold2740_cov418-Prasinococcus_capsulatus_cf.AAC.17